MRRQRPHKRPPVTISASPSPHSGVVNMYSEPPSGEVSLAELEEAAMHRIQVLFIIKQVETRFTKHTKEWTEYIRRRVSELDLNRYHRLLRNNADFEDLRADHISHFVLRLAFCRSRALREWFLEGEVDLFNLKLEQQTENDIKKIVETNNFVIASDTECYSQSCDVFYKLHFTDVTPLVAKRQVDLKRGYAYIPKTMAKEVILCKFRNELQKSLEYYQRCLPGLEEDRVQPLIDQLIEFQKSNYDFSSKAVLDIELLDDYSDQHFPLCMKHIHQVLRSKHHLQYGCRLQYGLFLKAIGVSVEDAIELFQEEFLKTMSENIFKKHLYNIKHQYGRVGKKFDYRPYSCSEILKQPVGVNQHHGCPFKHWDSGLLQRKLTICGMPKNDVGRVIQLCSQGNFEGACKIHFQFMNGEEIDSIVYPNQYFEKSVQLAEEEW